ncbi:MAG: ankyrin repeat domain-containing protein, partial [Rhabdochlamydiaceae bacterium]
MAIDIITELIQYDNPSALECFLKKEGGCCPSSLDCREFESICQIAQIENLPKCFEQLFKADVVSLPALQAIISKKNPTLICFLLETMADLPNKKLLILDTILEATVQLHQANSFSDAHLKKIIPAFFQLLQKSDYYTKAKHKNAHSWIDQIFVKGLNLGVIKIDTPFDEEGNRYLHLKIQNDKITQTILQLGADPNLQGSGKATAFHLAAQYSSLQTIKNFLDQGADMQVLDEQGVTPLGRSLESGRIEIALFLLKIRKGYDEVFPYCSMNEFIKLIPLLLNYLPTTSVLIEERSFFMSFLYRALELKIMNIDVFLDRNQNRFLHWAIEDANLVDFLLKNGANPDVANLNKKTPLHLAAERGGTKALELLLQTKANTEAHDNDNCTPLMRSIQNRQTHTLLLLHQYGASVPENPDLALEAIHLIMSPHEQVKEGDELKSLLKCSLAFLKKITMEALFKPEKDSIVLIFQYISSPVGLQLLKDESLCNIPITRDGFAPLHLAGLIENEETIQFILNQGGDIKATWGKERYTILHFATLATKNPHPLFIGFLLSRFPQLLCMRTSQTEQTTFETVLTHDSLRFLIPVFIENCNPANLIPALAEEMGKNHEPPRIVTREEIIDPNGDVQEVLAIFPNDPLLEQQRMAKYSY